MKIIGTTGSGFIVEASGEELKELIGYYETPSGERRQPAIYQEIKVHGMYGQLRGLANAQHELKTVSQTLHSIANLMLVADPLIEAVVNPEKKGG